MTDRYASFAHSGAGRAAGQAPRPARPAASCAGTTPGDPLIARPGARRRWPAAAAANRSRHARRRWATSARGAGAEASASRRPGVRRHRRHRLRPACARSTTSSTRWPAHCAQRPGRRAGHPARAVRRRPRGHRPAGPGGLRPLASARRSAGAAPPNWSTSRPAPRSATRVDPAVPALGRARRTSPGRSSGSAPAAGRRPRGLGPAARRPDRAGHRRGPGHRRGDRRGARPRRRARGRLDVPAAGERAAPRRQRARRHRAAARPDRRRTRRSRLADHLADAARPGRHRRAQRRHHPRQDARPDGRRPVGRRCSTSTSAARSGSTTCCWPRA